MVPLNVLVLRQYRRLRPVDIILIAGNHQVSSAMYVGSQAMNATGHVVGIGRMFAGMITASLD